MMTKLLALLLICDTGGPRRVNLVGAAWEKFHQTNIPDKWDVAAGKELTWFRTAGADGGSVGLMQALRKDVKGKLRLELEVRIDEHTLGGSGWWSDAHGQTGEYPVKIHLDYLDGKEARRSWVHGFLTADNPHKLRNYTKVKAGEWVKVGLDIDLGGPSTLTRIVLAGVGWSFKGGVRNLKLTQK